MYLWSFWGMRALGGFVRARCARGARQPAHAHFYSFERHSNSIRTTFEYNSGMPSNAEIERLPDGIAVVTLSGHLTLGSSLKLVDSKIQGAIDGGVGRMVLDLTAVDYVDSAGLGVIVCTYGALNEKSGQLRVCGVSARVLSLLKLTKSDTFLSIDPTREESLAALAKA